MYAFITQTDSKEQYKMHKVRHTPANAALRVRILPRAVVNAPTPSQAVNDVVQSHSA
jgi:hypothetical protein